MLATKDDDLPKIGWRIISRTEQIDVTKGHFWRLQPPVSRQRIEFATALRKVSDEGAWCCDIDETYHVADLGLESQIVELQREGRSRGISMVNGIQRPSTRRLPREIWSEATHIFCFRLTDGRDRMILRDQVGRQFADAVGGLDQYHYIYYNTITDKMTEGVEHTLRETLGYPKEN